MLLTTKALPLLLVFLVVLVLIGNFFATVNLKTVSSVTQDINTAGVVRLTHTWVRRQHHQHHSVRPNTRFVLPDIAVRSTNRTTQIESLTQSSKKNPTIQGKKQPISNPPTQSFKKKPTEDLPPIQTNLPPIQGKQPISNPPSDSPPPSLPYTWSKKKQTEFLPDQPISNPPPTSPPPTSPYFAIRRGAGCLDVDAKTNIVHFNKCRYNAPSQLFKKASNNLIRSKYHATSGRRTSMCLGFGGKVSRKVHLIVEPCRRNKPSQQWMHDQISNAKKAPGVTSAPQYTGVRLHTRDFQCIVTPSLIVPSTTDKKRDNSFNKIKIQQCNAYKTVYMFKDISKEVFYFVPEKNIQRPVIVVMQSSHWTQKIQVQLFVTRWRRTHATAPILFVHVHPSTATSKLFDKSKNNHNHPNIYHFDARQPTVVQRIQDQLAAFPSDQIIFANVESRLTSESDVQVLSNTLDTNPQLIGVGGMVIGQGNVLHRNCYTAINYNRTEKTGWVAGYHHLTIETKYQKRCMVCDRVAKPILTRRNDVAALLKHELAPLTATWNHAMSSPVWVTSLKTLSSINRRLASCPHFVALNDAFKTTSTILKPPGVIAPIIPITTVWKEDSPCQNKKAKQKEKAIDMWKLLKGTLRSLTKEPTFVGAMVTDGLLMQALKLGTIGPWDHDIDLAIAFSDCGDRRNIHHTGPGSDVRIGSCKRFLPALHHVHRWLSKMSIGEMNQNHLPRHKFEWAQLQLKLPYLYRNSHWADVCQRTEEYSLAEDWHDCLGKLRKDSLKSSFKTSGILQVDLHVKPGIEGSHAKNRLLVDLVGPPGSGEADGTVDEMRVSVYYDEATRELWHMEYIGVEYGNSWLEHPWECQWKYTLMYAAAAP